MSGVGIEEDRDGRIAMEGLPGSSPIWIDVTTAKRSCSFAGTVEATETTGHAGAMDSSSEVGIAEGDPRDPDPEAGGDT